MSVVLLFVCDCGLYARLPCAGPGRVLCVRAADGKPGAGARQAPRGGSYDLLQTVRESASHLRASLLDSLARQREQREATWEQDRSAWLERVREIGDNWRSELGREIQRTRTEIEDAIDISSVRRRAQDIYLSLPCSRSAFPSAGAKMIVDTLKTRAEPLGPLKAAALQRDEDVCAVCLDLMGAGERVIALPSCRHIFHWECLRPWLEKKGADSDCPFCKRSILPELSLDENKWAASVVERQLARESVLQRERAREQEREAEGVLAHLYDAHAQQRSPVASANPAVPTQAHDAAPSPGHASAQSRDAHAGSSERRGAHTHPFPASGIGGAQNHAAEAAHRVPRTAGPAGAGESGGGAGAGIDARHARGLRQQLYLARAGESTLREGMGRECARGRDGGRKGDLGSVHGCGLA